MYSLANIKDAMRINNTKHDAEIGRNINSCLSDLKLFGIKVINSDNTPVDDYLIDKAVELYCFAQMDYQGMGEKYDANYEKLRNAMQCSKDYRNEQT